MSTATSARIEVQKTPTPASPSAILFGICILLFFSVLSFGAVEAWSVSILECGMAVLFLGWAIHQTIRGEVQIVSSPLYVPVSLFAAVVASQLGFGITAYRYATLLASLEYLAYAILLFLTIQSVRSERSARTILWSLTLFGCALAVFAIVQDLTSNGRIYWLRTLHNGGTPFGTYVNHDHYAGVMEMLAPIPIVLSVGPLFTGGKRAMIGFAGIVMAGTIVLSQSRAGTASFLAEMSMLLGILLSKQRKGRTAAALGTLCLLIFAFVSWLATAGLWHRFGDLQDYMRLAMAKDGLRMFWHRAAIGWGLGTFTTVYPQFRSFYTTLFVNAAHNDYVQVLVETGIIGFVAVAWFIGAVYRRGLRNADGWNRDWSHALGLSALVGCTGLLVHSLFDFNLQIPANASIFYFLCAVTTNTGSLAAGAKVEKTQCQLK